MPACAIGIAIRPVPTPSSTTGPPDASASLDVEGDVLDDARAPRVVEPGDRVVARSSGLRATHTNSLRSSSNGRRSNQPYSASTSSPATSIRPSHSDCVTHQSESVGAGVERDVDAVVGRRVVDVWRTPSLLERLAVELRGDRGSKTNAFHAKRPPGRSAAATRSKTRRLSSQVGRWSSERNGQ